MRTREEIEKDVLPPSTVPTLTASGGGGSGRGAYAIYNHPKLSHNEALLETLLDIRDLLAQK